ncbi:MAG: hypothetical protein KBF73_10230 [Flavobacteriales bacterium]|nr:hypothetical protein [Flavobacteriales bacterium]
MEGLQNEKVKLEIRFHSDDFLNSLPNELKDNYRFQNYGLDDQFIIELTQQQLYSSYISVYAFFEGRLNVLCTKLEKLLSPSITLNDLNSRNYVIQYMTFLDKVIEVSNLPIKREMKKIGVFGTLRNKLAHQNGVISIGEKQGLQGSEIPESVFFVHGDKWLINLCEFDIQKELIQYLKQLLLDTATSVDETIKSKYRT